VTSPPDETQCPEAQPALTLYAPATKALILNGATITFESALVVIHQPTRNSLAFAVHEGLVTVSHGPTAGTGQTLVAVTDNAGSIVFWSAPRAHYTEETQRAQVTTQALNGLINEQFALTLSPPPAASACLPSTHIVQKGEWVRSIAGSIMSCRDDLR
jgi:hypothetical protein